MRNVVYGTSCYIGNRIFTGMFFQILNFRDFNVENNFLVIIFNFLDPFFDVLEK